MVNLAVDSQPALSVSPQPVPVNSSPNNFSKSILIGVLIFVLLSATAYGAYWYTKNYLVTPLSQPTVLNVSSETSQSKTSFSNLNNQATPAATDETAGWKTYTNEKINFSLKHPSNWNVKDIFDPKVVEPTIVELHTINRDYNLGTAADIYLYSPIGQPDSSRLKQIGITGSGTPKTFGNLNGRLYETDNIGEAGSGYRADFIFNHNSVTYWIYLTTGLEGKSVYNSVFDQILPTFKFLN